MKMVGCRLDRRREAVIAAARKLFLQNGYAGTTLSQIVDECGGSLATIYKLFRDKEGLLHAVISEITRTGPELVRQERDAGGSPPEILHRIAQRLHHNFQQQEDIALVRIVIAHSLDNPAFAQAFFAAKAELINRELELLFRDWQAEELVKVVDPRILADCFLALLLAELHNAAISHGTHRAVSSDEIRQRVDIFLRGAGMMPPAPDAPAPDRS